MPPRGQKRDFGYAPDCVWERSSNPNPEGKMKTDLNEDGTNVNGGVQPNINLGFGSETVGSFSSPRVNSSISDWGEFGLASPIPGMGPRVEVETPPSRLALVLSPPPASVFRETGEGDSVGGGGTRSAFQPHVRVLDLSRSPSRYPRSVPRFGLKRTSPLRSHGSLAGGAVMGAVDAMEGVNIRPPGRRGVRGLRTISDEEQHVEFRFSHADLQPHAGEDNREKRHNPPESPVWSGPSDLNRLSPGSPLSGPGVQIHSPTAGSLSPRTEVLLDSGFLAVREGYDTDCTLRRRFRPDRLNEIGTGKKKTGAGGTVNELGGVGFVNGCHPAGRLSVISVDGGEVDCAGLGDTSGQVERCAQADASQDWDSLSSRCSSSRSTPGSCAGPNFDPGSRGPPVDSFSTAFARSRYSCLSSDRGSVLDPHIQHLVTGRTMGDVLSPGSRFHLPIHHQTPISGSLKALIPSFPSITPKADPRTREARALRDNTELNAIQSTAWSIQTHKHVHSRSQEFDLLRFSSSSPSRTISTPGASPSISTPSHLFSNKDKLDEDRYNETAGSRPGLIGRLPLGTELRSQMEAGVTQGSNTRTGLNGDTEGGLLNRGALASKFINNRGDGYGRGLRRVNGIERGDMGGVPVYEPHLGSLDLDGRASLGSASGVSGVSVAGSLQAPSLVTGPHLCDGDTQSTAPPDSRATLVQSRSTDQEEPEECGLLKSLLESSDPWGLMRKTVLNLPSPTPSEVERRGKRDEEDVVRVKEGFGRRGVGYVTPPSMDALLGVVGSGDEVEMEDIEEGGGDNDDSQEILDFRSSQPRTDRFSLFFVRHAE